MAVRRRIPPHVRNSLSSRQAAESKVSSVDQDEKKILRWLDERGTSGSTTDEAEEALQLLHQTASARFNGLEKKGRIVRTCRFRPTRSGRSAQVYIRISLLCSKDRSLMTGTG